MRSLSLLTLFVASSLATKLLLPLYQWPDPTAYSSVYATIEAHPQLAFQIILNVDSGPGGPQPDSAFTTAAAKFTSYSNVELLGYLHCGYGAASASEVAENATNWAAWNSYSGASLSIDGIFFDETPNSEGSAGSNDVSFMQSLVESAKSAFGTHQFISMFNPGSTVEHSEYWTLADYNVIFEDDASAYSDSVLTTNIPTGKANQSSILIPGFADVGSESQAESWLQAMMEAGVGSAHILNYGYIEATSAVAPASIGSVAKVLASISGNSASSSATSVTSSSSTAVEPSASQEASSAVDTSAVSGESDLASSVDFSSSTKSSPVVLPTSFTTIYISSALSATADTSTAGDASVATFSAAAVPTPSSSGQDSGDSSAQTSGARPTWRRPHKHHHETRS